MQNRIRFLKRIKELSESNNNILPEDLSEFGNEKDVKSICKQLYGEKLITCEFVPSTDSVDAGEWLDVCDISLTQSGKAVLNKAIS